MTRPASTPRPGTACRPRARLGRPREQRPPGPALGEGFTDMLVAERGAAANTRLAYAGDLTDLAAFLAERGTAIDGAGEDDLRAYIAALTDGVRADGAAAGGPEAPRRPAAGPRTVARRRGGARPPAPPSRTSTASG